MVDNPPIKRPANSVREPTNLVVTSPSGATLEFTYPPQKKVSEYTQVPVRVDLDKLLEDITPEGRTGGKKAPNPIWSAIAAAISTTAAESDKSYRKIRSAISGGQLDMPEMRNDGFYEGNHRVLELKRQGFKEIYVLAEPEQAAAIEQKYGSGKQPPRKASSAQETPTEPETPDGPSAVEKYVNRGNPQERGNARGI
jgi:hypothetical protein